MRVALDIDSTIHHYWDVLSESARRRFGVELPYDEQFTWGITRLRPEQLQVCVEDTHTAAAVMAGRPYPGAVETINGWHAAGHFIHVTSHRHERSHDATARWLDQIGLAYDELYCSSDKISRCIEIGIDLLIDDSPINLQRALDSGIAAATILHPWNQELCDVEHVISGRTWAELAPALEERLGIGASRAA